MLARSALRGVRLANDTGLALNVDEEIPVATDKNSRGNRGHVRGPVNGSAVMGISS